MTIFFFTGFEGCSDSYMMRSIFDDQKRSIGAQDLSIAPTSGYESSVCLYHSSGYADWWKNVPAGNKTIVVGGHYKELANANGSMNTNYYFRRILTFVMGSTEISILYRHTEKELRVYSGLTEIGSASISLDGGIHHYEFKVFSNATTGFVQMKEDGFVIATISDINTDGGDIDEIGWGCNAGKIYVDNIYVADEYQGELYSKVLRPTSDGDSSQFTPSSGGDNFAMIDDLTEDADSTYVEANVVGYKDLYGYEDYSPADITLKGMFISTYARKTSGVGRSLVNVSKQDSTERDHSNSALVLTYPDLAGQGLCDFFDKCPDGTDWTFVKANAIQWGFKVAS